MKKYFVFAALIAIIIWLTPCTPTATVTSYGGQNINEARAERYDGPKARLAVGEFEDKTAKGSWSGGWYGMWGVHWDAIGNGMRDMLTTALFKTDRYIVLEREKLGAVLKEQDLATAGRIKKGTEARTGEIYGADLIITGSVTEFEGGAKGARGKTKILGVRIGGGVKKAHIAIDVRIIDAETSQIVAATSVEGKASSFALGGAARVGGNLPVSLGGFSKTPTEKAIRACIQEAVNFIVSRTPKVYYRHK